MRTPAYKETIAIGFNSLDEAKRKAQELNAEVYTSSYPSVELTINGINIPINEFVRR